MTNKKDMAPIKDGSPFDLPKSYIYETINDYHINKALQLIKIKNLDLALLEINGLYKCAQTDKSQNQLNEFKTLIEDLNNKINKRNQLREYYYTQFKNSKNKNDVVKEFIDQSSNLEEYSSLQNKISNYNNSDNLSEIIFSFDPLKYLCAIGKIEKENDLKPFILFDLDSTLFDNSPRVHKIIQDFINDHKDIYPEYTDKMKSIKRQDIVWGIKENLKKIDLHDEDIVNKVIKYWYDRFFSNEYIIDVPLKGSSNFIKDLENSGVRIIYLTGRFESMREGTERNINEHGFPLDPNGGNLVLKPDPRMPDDTFKHQSMEKMKSFGNMIAGFENEPVNSNIFQDHFPKSEIFFLETNHSLNPPNLNDKVHTIKDFTYLS